MVLNFSAIHVPHGSLKKLEVEVLDVTLFLLPSWNTSYRSVNILLKNVKVTMLSMKYCS